MRRGQLKEGLKPCSPGLVFRWGTHKCMSAYGIRTEVHLSSEAPLHYIYIHFKVYANAAATVIAELLKDIQYISSIYPNIQ